MPVAPFSPVKNLTVECVSSAPGTGKTYRMVSKCLERARSEGTKFIIAMPTLALIKEIVEHARKQTPAVPVVEYTSREDEQRRRKYTTTALLHAHMCGLRPDGKPDSRAITGGHLVFITHETMWRMTAIWPWPEKQSFELIVDEEPDIVLTRAPFKLRNSFFVISNWLDVAWFEYSPMARRARAARQNAAREAGLKWTQRDAKMEEWCVHILRGGIAGSSAGDYANAEVTLERLLKKKAEAEMDAPDRTPHPSRNYVQVVPKDPDRPEWIKRRVEMKGSDDIYEYLEPLGSWLLQDACLFTDVVPWLQVLRNLDFGYDKGHLTISAFRRPDFLVGFKRVTLMSALMEYTMMFDIWGQLGVNFKPSELIDIAVPIIDLGSRVLRIYWITDQGWSKRLRDRSGGIGKVFELIKKARVIDERSVVCVQTNKDDASENDPRVVLSHFPRARLLPHNVRGQNQFRGFDQMIHTAAFNSHTPDIRWIEEVFDISSDTQRIARTGQVIYQTLMRLSLREPSSTQDVSLVVMDKDVAEWLVQWFGPREQVEVIEIDSSGTVVRKGRPGRPKLPEPPPTTVRRRAAERQRKSRANRKAAAEELARKATEKMRRELTVLPRGGRRRRLRPRPSAEKYSIRARQKAG